VKGPFPLPVLMYHDLTEQPGPVFGEHGPYVLPATSFRQQLRTLADLGFIGTRLDALLDPASRPARGRCCVLTFDDGHESNCALALPLLLEAGFSATFYVTAGWIGRPPYMSWEQLKEVAAAGMEIGSHSLTHRPPASLTPAELRTEMADSRKLLEDRLGRAVLSASSPTGFFNPRMPLIVREIGYRALCIGRIALWRDLDDPYCIPRIPVKQATGPGDFRRMILGDAWLIGRMRGSQMTRNGLKKALGVTRYQRVREWLLGLAARGRPSGVDQDSPSGRNPRGV
jgi:peptidoglycan/xylan/chitin deacetylase (PgdA/CDA1 family)